MATTRHMGPISHHSLHHLILSLSFSLLLQFLIFLSDFKKPLKSSLCLFLLVLFCCFLFLGFLSTFDFFTLPGFSLSSSSLKVSLFLDSRSLSFVGFFLSSSAMITEMEKGGSELELGLGLSLGGGTATATKTGKPGGGAWGERGRLLTAKDFPSVGSKRAADSASHAGSSPPRSSQVVGWPPIGSHRMNSLATKSAAREEEEASKKKVKDDVESTKDVTKKVINGKVQVGFIKVNMDGVAIGRKVDMNAHSSYENLAQTLEDMFFKTNPGTTIGLTGQFTKPLRLLDGSSEYVLTYEDKEGDWMLVGDVPWRMFITSVKRLRVMKTSEANGLAARRQEPNERQRKQPV